MADFNLGYIKGPKGDTGPKGDVGPKGDTGAQGADGITPVFSIEKVETLEASLPAKVEIDISEPESPKLAFYIPKGKDGIDAAGDMQSAFYDTEGRKSDIYKFAKELSERCVQKSGDALAGALKAFSAELEAVCVRNISFQAELPENPSIGDICVLMAREEGHLISEYTDGSVVLLEEGGVLTEYIVAGKNYHGENSVTLIRKYLLDEEQYFDYKIRDDYSCSDADIFLSSVFISRFSVQTQKLISFTKLEENFIRQCFLPSFEELSELTYFANGNARASTSLGIFKTYLSRTVDSAKKVRSVSYNGEFSVSAQNTKLSLRPMLVFSGNVKVKNLDYNGAASGKLAEGLHKAYFYDGAGWKELNL